ncbi:MAG: hypothetical protein CME70_12335 [Halobacteriovorax sp.]|nr:hypothetical protein [Halobacteriovorax sp.]|tara:strand:+ start:262255 stop:263043 length:789 start_codon:yes stop_codon:yes gene_type:complete
MKTLLYSTLLSLFISLSVAQAAPAPTSGKFWKALNHKLKKAGANPKMLKHVYCFLKKGQERSFEFKKPRSSSYNNRCYKKSQYQMGSNATFAMIDYTAPSKEKRMFLVNRLTGDVKSMAVAHGRYKSGYMRRFTKKNHNSIRWAKYFSNSRGSNAPSSGFYLAGMEYRGKWDRSLVLNGLETSNNNACERAVVVHAHKMVSDNKVYTMSSGCPMVSKGNIDTVIDALVGKGNTRDGLDQAGGLVFIYGPREAAWPEDYCGEI